tara:strand:+ start:851 stop:1600 length:750 start_codon:yes stop_codon:yes gene_type:complete
MNKSYVIYDGPSLIDGKPIVAIAQVKSSNRKTGDMVQTWILRSDIDPISASRTGEDVSICGDCPHKGKPSDKDKGWAVGRSCYVNLLFAPNGVYKAYNRGSYPIAAGHGAIRAIGLGLGVRLGSYGDPAAVPEYVWRSLTSAAEYVTAYTHGENTMADMVMTSADNAQQAQIAWDKPIPERTFRVVSSIDKLIKGKEILCPASEEAKEMSGKAVTCAACKLCGGNSVKAKSIAIVAHGAAKRTTKGLVE